MNGKNMQVAKPMLVAAVLATVVWVSAGDLNPPAGPITATQRIPIGDNTTPGDVLSVFKITQPGSYYLTGNVKGVVGKHGIEIDASGVTLDLMGFEVAGVAGSLEGIHTTNPVTNIAVMNGSVRNWDRGVNFFSAFNARLADLRASGNITDGILSGNNSVVTGCNAYLNGGRGIAVSTGTISNCSARANTTVGIAGITGSMITNCSSRQNGTDGIETLDGGSISNCTVDDNGGVGIDANEGNTITNCSVSNNTLDGIRVFSDNTIRGNTCWSNGNGGDGAGIHAEGTDNRIDANNSTDADRGIDVDFAGNFITRNTCSGNTTNWDVVASNNLLVVIAVDAGAVLGNSGGVSPGSTDPSANFSY